MELLYDLIKNNQAYLLKKTLSYAKLHNYVKYTSTLEEAWVASISGLSAALLRAIETDNRVPEIEVDHDFLNDPISSFGVVEAQRHRHRGIDLGMFLGLFKYYRQAYLDLVTESIEEEAKQHLYLLWINRYFDHNEIAFCAEWADKSNQNVLLEMQNTNRQLTNEKNKYLTIFESIPTPVILLDADNRCDNMNYAALQLLVKNFRSPGQLYYSDIPIQPKINDTLPWIINEFMDFYSSESLEATIEKDFESPTLGLRNLIIKFHRMLDVSNKFEGTVIIFTDQTEQKKIEEQLRHLSFRDNMTGLYNRSYLEQECVRMASGRFNPVGFISCDVDGLKLVNDNLGHHAGDMLLNTVGQILKNCFRDCDVVARIGGDEFAVLMPLSDESIVRKACQRIRSKVEEHNLHNLSMPVSISIGWTSVDLAEYMDIHAMIKEADGRMYHDKQNNRGKYISLFNQRLDQFGKSLFLN